MLLIEDKEAHLISPWFSDVELKPPPNSLGEASGSLSRLLMVLKARGVKVYIYTRPEREFTEDDHLRRLFLKEFHVMQIENLHVKSVITTRLAYYGSANLTYHGLYVNKEECRLERVRGKPSDMARSVLA